MKYLVKCPYCEHTYFVDSKVVEEDFQCDTCGGQNSIDDVIERVQDEVIVEKEVIKTVIQKEVIDPELKNIKSFDITRYSEDNESESEDYPDSELNIFKILEYIILGIVMLAMVYASSTYETEEEKREKEVQQKVDDMLEKRENSVKISAEASKSKAILQTWMKAMQNKDIETLRTCYDIPDGSILSDKDLERMIKSSRMEQFWGSAIQIDDITLDNYQAKSDFIFYMVDEIQSITYKVYFSNGSTERIKLEKTDAGEMKMVISDDDLINDVKIRSAVKEDEDLIDIMLHIDEFNMDYASCEIVTDEDGISYSEYTIPMIVEGNHTFSISTILDDMQMTCEISEDLQEILLDHFSVSEESKAAILAVWEERWYQICNAAMEYAEVSELRKYFDERITDEEISDIAKLIRMEQGKQGYCEGASISELVLPEDGILCATAYNQFIVEFEIPYISVNEENASGVCRCKLGIIFTNEGWKVYENYDNRFFTLVNEEVVVEGE